MGSSKQAMLIAVYILSNVATMFGNHLTYIIISLSFMDVISEYCLTCIVKANE
jgi:hypothetical protein